MRSTLCLTLASCCFSCLIGAAEGGDTIQPVPGFVPGSPTVTGPQPVRPQVQFPRPLPAYEVETVTVKASDSASVTAWTLLAAQGYHVTAATPVDGGVVLYLERMSGMGGGQGGIQLPAILEQDKATADGVRAKIKAINDERQKAARLAGTPGVAAPQPAQK